MPQASSTTRIDLEEVNARAETAHHVITGFARAVPAIADLWRQVDRSLSGIPTLTTEIARLHHELTRSRLDRANLAAAGKASIAAHRSGEPDCLSYLRDELDAQGYGTQGRPA